jgi:hypothetical protein
MAYGCPQATILKEIIVNNAKILLAIANQIKMNRYIESRPKPIALSEKSHAIGIYLGFDSTIGQAQVKILATGQTITARVITNGHIGVGQRVMVKIDGATAFVNEMPAR